MEGIPIYYTMQSNEHDDSLNIFFLPSSFKSQNEVQIKDVVQNFPLLNSGRYYHFRFYALCDKDQKTWVDISNMTAKVPVVDNRILVKVLDIEKPGHSRIFASYYKSGVPNTQPQSTPEQSHHSREPTKTQTHPVKKSVSSEVKPAQNNYQEQPPLKPSHSHHHHQQQQQQQSKPQANPTKTPPAKSTAADDFDLLGGSYTASSSERTQKSAPQNTADFSPFESKPKASEDEKVYKMSHEELGAYKQNKMDNAIQAQVDFANAVWQNEEQSKQDKAKAYDELEDQIKNWAGKLNQRNNIIALLSTLHNVIWQGSDWKPLSFSDLMGPAAIKKNYFKAITKFHPDKNQGGDYRQKYICERVTNELNAAWDEFRKTNP